jgi:hypothetical protein
MAIVIDDFSAAFVDRHNSAKKGIGDRLPLLLEVKRGANSDHLHVGQKEGQVMSPAAKIDLPQLVPNCRKAILHAFERYVSVLGIDCVIREVIHPDDVANLLGGFPLP